MSQNIRLAVAAAGGAVVAGALYALWQKKKKSVKLSNAKLTYFGIHGAGEKVRLALVATGTPFEDDRVAFDTWMERKKTCKYGQLPILSIDGEEYYQSDAMLRYIGAYCGSGKLYPTDDPALTFAIDEAFGLCEDFDRAWNPCVYIAMRPAAYGYGDDFTGDKKTEVVKSLREKFVENELPRFMGYFSARLEKSVFLVGDSLTIADLRLLPRLLYFAKGKADHVSSDVLKPYPLVTAYMERVMSIPSIAAWYADPSH